MLRTEEEIMKKNERINKVIKTIDLLIEELNRKNTDNYFAYKNTLRLLVFKNGFELEDLFREYIPAEKLGLFDTVFRTFVSNPSFMGNHEEVVQMLLGAKQLIKDYCQYKNLHVFYSWQSDIANNINRGFIQKAIQDAIEEINQEKKLEIFLDQDTRGECGSPDIVNTILRKIDNSDVFIADVSSISNNDKKSFPNPNVMFELGYAYKTLGDSRIIMVYNESSGDINNLPFDLGLKRQMVYKCSDSDEKSKLREGLKTKIKSAIIGILEAM
jgi:hypothetical protein